MAFRCGNLTEPAFPCLMGGQCGLNHFGNEVCSCPEGFGRDFVGFGHFSNCALPRQFLPGFFYSLTVLLWTSVAFTAFKLYRSPITGRLRRISQATTMWSVFTWIHVLCVFVEEGFFEASLVSFAALTISGFVVSYHACPMVLEPILMRAGYSLVARNLRKWLLRITVVSSMYAVAMTGGLIAICRGEEHVETYNILMIVLLWGIVVLLLVEVSLLLIAARKLRTLLPAEATTVAKQLNAIIKFCYLVVTAASGTLGLLIVWIVLHSLPFMYVQWAICQVLGVVVMVYIQPLVQASKSSTSKSDPTVRRQQPEAVRSNDQDGDQENSSFSATASSSRKVQGLGLKPRSKPKSAYPHRKPRKEMKNAMSRITEIEESQSSVQDSDRLGPYSESH